MALRQEFPNFFPFLALYLINCWELICPTSILQGCECKNTGLQPNLIYCLGSRCLLRKARTESHKYLAKNIHQQNFNSPKSQSPKIVFWLLEMRTSETAPPTLTFKHNAKKFCGVAKRRKKKAIAWNDVCFYQGDLGTLVSQCPCLLLSKEDGKQSNIWGPNVKQSLTRL